MNFKFKKQNSNEEKRRQETIKIKEKYPDRVPIVCERDPRSDLADLDKSKYLCPMDMTVSQFSYLLRKRLQFDKSTAFYLLVDGRTSITGDSSLKEIYDRYRQDDGYLYICYSGQIIWGLK
jgi:GABA(A) receptor-associated protein